MQDVAFAPAPADKVAIVEPVESVKLRTPCEPRVSAILLTLVALLALVE